MTVSLIIERLRTHLTSFVFVAFLLVQGGFGLWSAIDLRNVDFASYYFAAKTMQQGGNVYTADFSTLAMENDWKREAPPYLYPPLAAAVVSVFDSLPIRAASVIWFALSFSALTLSGLVLSQLTRKRWVDPLVFGALTLYVPNLTTFYAGQINNIVLAGVALYLFLAVRGRHHASGLPLAVAVMLKPLAAPLLALLFWRREVRKLVLIGISLLVLLLLTILLAGPQTVVDYLSNWQVPHLSVGGVPSAIPTNQSLSGFFARAFTLNEFSRSLTNDVGMVRLFWYGSAGIMLVFTAILTWPHRKCTQETLAFETGLVLVATLLIAPLAWYHHAVIAIVALLLCWYAAPSRFERALLVLAVLLIDVQGLAWHRLQGYTLLLSLGTYGLLIIYGVSARHLLKMRRSTLPKHVTQLETS